MLHHWGPELFKPSVTFLRALMWLYWSQQLLFTLATTNSNSAYGNRLNYLGSHGKNKLQYFSGHLNLINPKKLVHYQGGKKWTFNVLVTKNL